MNNSNKKLTTNFAHIIQFVQAIAKKKYDRNVDWSRRSQRRRRRRQYDSCARAQIELYVITTPYAHVSVCGTLTCVFGVCWARWREYSIYFTYDYSFEKRNKNRKYKFCLWCCGCRYIYSIISFHVICRLCRVWSIQYRQRHPICERQLINCT